MDWPAVRLFADRAAAVRPEFAVTEDNVAEIVKICRRLDGLPLAIELAAARLRSLPVERLAAGLDDRFALLTSGSRTAAARHRTLRAALAWSWDLLDDEERRFAQRLAVFPRPSVWRRPNGSALRTAAPWTWYPLLWTNRCCSFLTAPSRGTACSRRSGSTRWSGWTTAAP